MIALARLARLALLLGWVAADEQFKWADRHIQVLAAASFVAWARLLQHLRVWRRAAILMLALG